VGLKLNYAAASSFNVFKQMLDYVDSVNFVFSNFLVSMFFVVFVFTLLYVIMCVYVCNSIRASVSGLLDPSCPVVSFNH